MTMREENEGSRSERPPAGRRERPQIVAVGHGGQTGEDITQIGQRIDPMAAAGDHQRVDDRGAITGIGMTDKKPVFLVMLS